MSLSQIKTLAPPKKNLLIKISFLLRKLQKRWGFDANEIKFMRATQKLLKKKPLLHAENPKFRRILVQIPPDYFYLSLFLVTLRTLGCTKEQLAGLWPLNIIQSPRDESFANIRHLIRQTFTYFDRKKWQRLYRHIGINIFSSLNTNIWQVFLHQQQAHQIWQSIRSKQDLLALSINGTYCGDLIYDTYLRFRVQATVDLADPYLCTLITQTLNTQAAIRKQLAKEGFDCFLTSYSSYIQHGIPVREALRSDIAVFSSGNLSQYYKKLSKEDTLHTSAHWKYKTQFSTLPTPKTLREIAQKQLENRFRGTIDKATRYMKSSAYSNSSSILPKNIEGVVFLHDFFDSPHCYRNMLFEDFWEWAKFTLEVIQTENLPIAIKPHPNQLPESTQVVRHLQELFPQIQWLDSSISNLTIFNSGIRCGVSVYGTILHELAYYGIPALAAGDHPHISFDIAITPNTISEYKKYLINFRELQTSNNVRDEVLEFYYMHNIFNKEDLVIDNYDMNLRNLDPNDSIALDQFVGMHPLFKQN